MNFLHMIVPFLSPVELLVGVVNLLVFLENKLKCHLLSTVNFQSFEAQVMMYDGWKTVLCVLIYRPPRYNKDFIQQFSEFLITYCANL